MEEEGAEECIVDTFCNEDNADFIAHARQDIPDLLAYVEELEETCKQLLEWHASFPYEKLALIVAGADDNA